MPWNVFRGFTTSLRWPAPYEWGALVLAAIAAGISFESYRVSQESLEVSRATEAAQKENLVVICGPPTLVDSVDPQRDQKSTYIVLRGIATIVNASRSPVSVVAFTLDIPTDRNIGPAIDSSTNKGKAEHSLADQAISLQPSASTTVSYHIRATVPAEQARKAKISGSKTTQEVYQKLIDQNVDIFDPNAVMGDAVFDSPSYPAITLTALTVLKNSFSGACNQVADSRMR
jgi:hypothetical protein